MHSPPGIVFLCLMIWAFPLTLQQLQLSQARCGVAVVALSQRLVVVGGGLSDCGPDNPPATAYDVVEQFDVESQTRVILGHISEPRGFLSAISFHSKLAFAGGMRGDGQPSDIIDVYDFSTWFQYKLSSPSAKCSSGYYENENQVFFFMGDSGSSIDVFDVSPSSWKYNTTITVSPSMKGASMILAGHYIVVAGGENSYVLMHKITGITDRTGITWENVTLPTPREYITFGARSKFYNTVIFGGGKKNGVYSCDVDIMTRDMTDPNKGPTWKNSSLSECRDSMTAVNIEKYFIFAGGWGDKISSAVDIYCAADNAWFSTQLPTPTCYMGGYFHNDGKSSSNAIFAGGITSPGHPTDALHVIWFCDEDRECTDNVYCNNNDLCNKTSKTCYHEEKKCHQPCLECSEEEGKCVLTTECKVGFSVSGSIVGLIAAIVGLYYLRNYLNNRYYVRVPYYHLDNVETILLSVEEDDDLEKLDPKLLVRGEVLGAGGQGVVYKGRYKGREVAIKTLSNMNSEAVAQFAKEVNFTSQLKHNHIVEFVGVVVDSKANTISLVTELLDTDLHNRNVLSTLPLTQKLRVVNSVASAMYYLHTHRPPVLHRDLKPSNVLLSFDGRCKITDFGISRLLPEIEATITQHAGSCMYMAPEVFESGHYNEKCDVYSFGVLFAEVMNGGADVFPDTTAHFSAGFMKKLMAGDIKPVISETCPVPISRLIKRCTSIEPDDRPSFDEICDDIDIFLDASF